MILNYTLSSCFLSHDTVLRCDLVDLYYALYGSRRPACIPIPELAAILKSHRSISHLPEIKRIKPSIPKTNQNVEVKTANVMPKDIGNDVILVEENLNMNVVDIEVVMANDISKVKPKVQLHLFISFLFYFISLQRTTFAR